MEFGVFYQIPCGAEQTPAGRYADVMAQARLADALGYDMAWLAELHFARRFSVMPAPLLMASALSQTTERIMLGTAVNLLPLHHPRAGNVAQQAGHYAGQEARQHQL